MQNIPWLSVMLFLPLAAGLVVLAMPRSSPEASRSAAIIGSLLTLAFAILVNVTVGPRTDIYQFEESFSWIPAIGASYHIGVDGISLGLVLLTTILAPLTIWYSMHRGEDTRNLLAMILVLETCLLGVLLSADMLLFYVFWEAMLIPMYFLIAVWGGQGRGYASLKFILFMMVGSLLMLVGILWFYWWYHSHVPGGPFTFNLVDWFSMSPRAGVRIPHDIQMWMFFFFFLSFAIKVPLFPFHTWLPDSQAEGPLPFNILLVEVGAYAFIRFCLPLFPDASLTWAPIIMTLAVINVIYAAVMAIVQQDLKRLFAYGGMSHGGFIMLGIFSMTTQGLQGAILYMINSGITAGGLFIIADLLYRRRSSRAINDFGGLAPAMPLLYFIFMVVALGAIGLPGLNGFTSEFLCMVGAIRTNVVSPWYGYLSGAGVVLSAVYMLWMFQRVMFGNRPPALANGKDLDGTEKTTLWPIVILIFLLGVGSAWVTRPMLPAVTRTISLVQHGAAGTGHPVPSPDTPQESSPR